MRSCTCLVSLPPSATAECCCWDNKEVQHLSPGKTTCYAQPVYLPASTRRRQDSVNRGSISHGTSDRCYTAPARVQCGYRVFISIFVSLPHSSPCNIGVVHLCLGELGARCKAVVAFGMAVGSFSRAKTEPEDKGLHAHSPFKAVHPGVCEQLFCRASPWGGGCERRALVSVCHYPFLPLQAGKHGRELGRDFSLVPPP